MPSFAKTQTGVVGTATTGTTATATFASNPTAGNLVTFGVLFFDGSGIAPTFTVKDGATPQNSYTVDAQNSGTTNINAAGFVGQGYLLSAPSNANKAITVTFNRTIGGAAGIWCDEWTPTGGTVSLDNSPAAANGTGAITGPTVTVTGTNDLVYCTGSDASDLVGATGSFTLNEGGLAFGNGSEWIINQSANKAASYTGTASQVWNAIGMSFKITASGTTTHNLPLMGIGT